MVGMESIFDIMREVFYFIQSTAFSTALSFVTSKFHIPRTVDMATNYLRSDAEKPPIIRTGVRRVVVLFLSNVTKNMRYANLPLAARPF